jgi:hypothetical protein
VHKNGILPQPPFQSPPRVCVSRASFSFLLFIRVASTPSSRCAPSWASTHFLCILYGCISTSSFKLLFSLLCSCLCCSVCSVFLLSPGVLSLVCRPSSFHYGVTYVVANLSKLVKMQRLCGECRPMFKQS